LYSLRKAWGRSSNLGLPLPEVYPSFSKRKMFFRRATTSMLAGAPGSFKTCLAMNLLTRWGQSGLYGMYFSADMDEFSTAKRVAAIITGDTVDESETGLRADDARYLNALNQVESTRWIYKAADINEIDRHVRAYDAVFGRPPDVVFVDNLLNMTDSGTDDWGLARNFIRDLDVLAREAVCHVCVLHHTSESDWRKNVPPPRASVMGKLAQFPRLMLTIAPSEGDMHMRIAAVKNSHGPQDPSGDTYIELDLNPEKMLITEPGGNLF
jgi:hypothetical protein